MNSLDHKTLSGALIAWPVHSDSFSKVSDGHDNIVVRQTEVTGWKSVTLALSEPLANEVIDEEGEYVYEFLMRENYEDGNHAAIFGLGRFAIELLKYLGVSNQVVRPSIGVEELVECLIRDPGDKYFISRMYANVAGFGDALRSIALYGDDIATALESDFFSENVLRIRSHESETTHVSNAKLTGESILKPYRVELRDAVTGIGVLSFSKYADLTFVYRGTRSLFSVVDVLAYLKDHKFLRW